MYYLTDNYDRYYDKTVIKFNSDKRLWRAILNRGGEGYDTLFNIPMNFSVDNSYYQRWRSLNAISL